MNDVEKANAKELVDIANVGLKALRRLRREYRNQVEFYSMSGDWRPLAGSGNLPNKLEYRIKPNKLPEMLGSK